MPTSVPYPSDQPEEHHKHHDTASQTSPPAPTPSPQPTQTPNLFSPQPSSSTTGFFQPHPQILNQHQDDHSFRRGLTFFLPSSINQQSLGPSLSTFADQVLTPQILKWVADAERNPPYLRTWDTWGVRRDELVTSEGWRSLQSFGIKEGMVGLGFQNEFKQYSRVYHFAKYHLWCGSSAWVNCPSLMTDGAAALLRKHLTSHPTQQEKPGVEKEVFRSAYERLVSCDPAQAWTTGQWMTERAGGSDVSQTETVARYSPDLPRELRGSQSTDGQPLGPWVIDGFKWFSSATDSQMMVLLARTPDGKVSAFYAPMRRAIPSSRRDGMGNETELNGVYIQRLKNKLGTRALPTAEMELKGVRAWLIGEQGKGTKEIATVLNIARIHNAVSAIGFWGRGLGVSRAFARVRKVGLKPLTSKTAYIRTLAKMHAEYRANVLFTFFVVALLGIEEQKGITAFTGQPAVPLEASTAIPDPSVAEHLLRLLTPAVKGITAKKAIAGLAECMESMGGVGYLENDDMQFNIARLYRDANVLSIWEGTTDMMAHDVLRVCYGKTGKEVMVVMDKWVEGLLTTENNGVTLEAQAQEVRRWWIALLDTLKSREREEVEMRAREVMERLADVVMGVLLIVDARRDGDRVAQSVAEMWIAGKMVGGSAQVDEKSGRSWRDVARREREIVFGLDEPEAAGVVAKL